MALAALLVAVVLWPPVFSDHAAVRRAAAGLQRAIRVDVEQAPGPAAYLPNRPWRAGGAFLDIRPERFPGVAAAFVIFFPTDVVAGRVVRFVSSDPRTLAARDSGGRIASLLVEPGELAAPPPAR